MLIKTTDFNLGAYIPNRDDAPNSDIIGNEPILQGFIDEEVKNILVRLLGYELFSLLEDELVDGELPIGSDQRWLDLVNGKDSYQGLKVVLVPYVFFKFLENDNEDYSTQGVNKITSEGSNIVRPSRKMNLQWRKFYESAIGTYGGNPSVIQNSQGVGVIWGYAKEVSRSGYKSLFQFLSETGTTYPEWAPAATPKQINHYDI